MCRGRFRRKRRNSKEVIMKRVKFNSGVYSANGFRNYVFGKSSGALQSIVIAARFESSNVY